MKKTILTFVVLLLAGISAFAEVVSRSEAEAVAKTYMRSSSVTLALETEGYFVFNNPSGGWVMVAADNYAVPILAHSVEGSFDSGDVPVNFKNWSRILTKNIRAVRKAELQPTEETLKRWEAPSQFVTKASGDVLIETAKWGQGSPYNKYCPSSSVTGCVATAMAIFMRSQQWPAKGKGTIPAYKTESKGYNVSAIDISNYEYDWSSMPLTDGSSVSWTSAQKEAVSRLMQHCGAMVEMDYSPDGSGAMSSYIIPALSTYMSYTPKAVEEYRCDFSNYEWFKLIKNEIDAGRPILYGGSDEDTEEGHQFICDGYNSNYEIHINWGWGGTLNGWYAVNYIGDKSKSGVNDVFSYYDSAIFGLGKDPEGGNPENITLYFDADGDYYGLSLESGNPQKKEAFTARIGYIRNDYDIAYNGKIKLMLCDKDGNPKETLGAETDMSIKAASGSSSYTGAISSYSGKINGSISFGDYIAAFYLNPYGEWIQLGGEGAQTKIGVYDIPYLVLPETTKAGQYIYFEFVPGWDMPYQVDWYFDGAKNTKGAAKLTAGSHTVKAELKYSSGRKVTLQKVVVAN